MSIEQSSTMAELVHLERADGVARIILDSPHNRNALSAQLRSELQVQLAVTLDDDDVRVIVLGHRGSVFCAGADLKEVGSVRTGVSAPEFTEILRAILHSPKPVVAQVEGPARAGGLGLIAACDITIGSSSATFALSEVRIGVVAAVISMTLLPRMLPHVAQELFLTGETFDASRAVEVGLLNRAVPPDEVSAEVDRYCKMLVRGAPGALASTKKMLASRGVQGIEEGFAEMEALSAAHFASDEGREGVAAFVDKREPNWIPH
jgi:methylglutaconyl-CoA hydratase